MSKRRTFTATFKAKVALEALKGDQTLAALAARYKVHPNLITKWKRQAGEGLAGIFAGQPAGGETSHAAEIKELHAKIGELTVEKSAVRAYAAPLSTPTARVLISPI